MRRHPRGVLLWNVFGRVDAARELISAHQPIETSTLQWAGQMTADRPVRVAKEAW